MSKRKPYVRPMAGWWKKNPFFVEYMAHEGTAIFIAIYAFILTAGLVSLSQGKEAYESWLGIMQSPLSLLLHIVLLAACVYHAISWFKIMPRTLPPIGIGSCKLTPCEITSGGMIASVVANICVLVLAWEIFV